MTGSGYATVEDNGRSVTVGIRALNSRYMNMVFRLPRGLEEMEDRLRRAVQERCKRGQISVEVVVDEPGSISDGNVAFDRKRFEAYASVLDAIERDYGKRIDIAQVLDMKDLVLTEEGKVQVDQDSVMKAFADALDDLDRMRVEEGKAIGKDILARLKGMEEDVEGIIALSEKFLPEARESYRARISELMNGTGVDENRILQEAAILAEKLDVTEECIRSRSHISQFKDLVDSPEPVGKRLNFLLQELSREVNTIGAKSDRLEISRIVVELKDKVEKVKEQVQNVL